MVDVPTKDGLMSRSALAVLAALILGYAAHGLPASAAQASPPQSRGASAGQLSAINHKLGSIARTLDRNSSAIAALAHTNAANATAVNAIKSAVVDGAGSLALNVLMTCLTVEQSAGHIPHCE
jgi:hypothetical protein